MYIPFALGNPEFQTGFVVLLDFNSKHNTVSLPSISTSG